MTAYKLVTVDAPIWGFGNRLEETIQAVCFINLIEMCMSIGHQ